MKDVFALFKYTCVLRQVTVAQLGDKAEGRTGVRAVVKEDVARCGEIREIPKTRTKHKIDRNTSPW